MQCFSSISAANCTQSFWSTSKWPSTNVSTITTPISPESTKTAIQTRSTSAGSTELRTTSSAPGPNRVLIGALAGGMTGLVLLVALVVWIVIDIYCCQKKRVVQTSPLSSPFGVHVHVNFTAMWGEYNNENAIRAISTLAQNNYWTLLYPFISTTWFYFCLNWDHSNNKFRHILHSHYFRIFP